MDEHGRNEPHAGANPYAPPGTAAPVIPPVNPGGAAAAGETRYPIEFTARAGEYFRIWIVNLALTILTLGIYSAWAKVRKKRYFYGHTSIDGDNFDYRANPINILKGRIIAVVLFAAYTFGGKISPLVGVACTLVLVFAMPWLIVRSLAFNAHNSAYRNIRFNFRGTDSEPLKLLIGGGTLIIISLGVGYPYVKSLLVRFVARNHAFGTTSFALGAITKSFYGVYFKAFGLLFLGAFTFGVIAAGSGIFKSVQGGISGGIVVFTVLIYAAYLVVYAYLHAQTTNVTWNAMTIGPLHFECALRGRDLAWIYLVNILAILCTLGLATPWAVVRTMRYRAEKLTLVAAASLTDFIGAEAGNVSATGEEVGEMFDIGVGL